MIGLFTQSLVSVIIITYNSEAVISDCLKSISKQTYRNIEVIVVDSGSKDRTLSIVANIFPRATVIVDAQNHGFCYSQNLGLTVAKGDFVFMVNSDCELDPSCIEECVKLAIANASIAAIAPKIFLPRFGMRLDSAGTHLNKDLSGLNRGHFKYDDSLFQKPCEVFGVSDAAALYRVSALSSAGGFDASLVMYQEETDICLRLRMLGFKIVYAPRAIAHHLYAATVGEFSYRKIYYSERNHLWIIIKYCPWSLMPYCLAWSVFIRIRLMLISFRNRHSRLYRIRQLYGILLLPKLLVSIVASTVQNRKHLKKQRYIIQSRFGPKLKQKILQWQNQFAVDPVKWYIRTRFTEVSFTEEKRI